MGGNVTFLGFTVACFSLGRLASTFSLGFLTPKLSYQTLFIACSITSGLGCLLYGIAGIRESPSGVALVRRE